MKVTFCKTIKEKLEIILVIDKNPILNIGLKKDKIKKDLKYHPYAQYWIYAQIVQLI